MKKVLVVLALGMALMSCSKEEIDNADNSVLLVEELEGKSYIDYTDSGYYFVQDNAFWVFKHQEFYCLWKIDLEGFKVVTSTVDIYVISYNSPNGDNTLTVTRGTQGEMNFLQSDPIFGDWESSALGNPNPFLCTQ